MTYNPWDDDPELAEALMSARIEGWKLTNALAKEGPSETDLPAQPRNEEQSMSDDQNTELDEKLARMEERLRAAEARADQAERGGAPERTPQQQTEAIEKAYAEAVSERDLLERLDAIGAVGGTHHSRR